MLVAFMHLDFTVIAHAFAHLGHFFHIMMSGTASGG